MEHVSLLYLPCRYYSCLVVEHCAIVSPDPQTHFLSLEGKSADVVWVPYVREEQNASLGVDMNEHAGDHCEP